MRNGVAVPVDGTADGTFRVYGAEGAFLALSRVQQGRLSTIKSFFEAPAPNTKEREQL